MVMYKDWTESERKKQPMSKRKSFRKPEETVAQNHFKKRQKVWLIGSF